MSSVADPEICKRGVGGRKTMYQTRCYLLQMHIVNYHTRILREKATWLAEKNSEANWIRHCRSFW